MIFLGDTLRQTVANLRRDGELWHRRTWTSAARWLFGRRGLVRATLKPWYAYFRRDFHPRQQESWRARRWLLDNAAEYSVVVSAQARDQLNRAGVQVVNLVCRAAAFR
jgi:uncharacterized protein